MIIVYGTSLAGNTTEKHSFLKIWKKRKRSENKDVE